MKRIAAYCRVSTDKSDQLNSLENQIQYFKNNALIKKNKLIEIYVDEGLSGTSTAKRQSFNHMINDAKDRKFDLIITKGISRFARNTLDSIYYTRLLKGYGVGVLFLNENINTLDDDSELRLVILASIAQEESRNISSRVKWGQTRQMERGVVFGRSMLGYDIKNGKIKINEQGAKIVKLIYKKFLKEGKGCHKIANELNKDGIISMQNKLWTDSVIYRILKNEKYCGDLIQKKTITVDYLTHKKKYNKGEEEKVIIHNHHAPIISKNEFTLVQKKLSHKKA